MNVTHRGQTYTARPDGPLVFLHATDSAPLFICSLCGAEGSSAEQIPHKLTCLEYATPARKTA